MPWVKIDDGFFDNATNRRLGPAGRDLFIASLAFCAKGLTDGRIDKDDLALLLALAQAKKPTVKKLLDAGRWIEHPDHYEVAEYLTYQPSKAQVLAEREAARERQRRRRHGVTASVTPAEGSPEVTGTPTRPDLDNTPQPPAERGATDQPAHHGQHPNCRACGTNRRTTPTRPTEPPNPSSRLPRAADLVLPPLTPEQRAAADQAKTAALAAIPFRRTDPAA